MTRFRSALATASLVALSFVLMARPVRADRGHGRIFVPDNHAHSSHAPTSGRGHFGEEIEGIVTAVDTGASTISLTDERLGDVVVTVDDSTIIRHGSTPVALGDIPVGARIHVKASPQDGGGFLAAAVFVQNDGTGGGSENEAEVQGTVASIDCGANTMTVTTDSGDVIVTLDPSTTFKKQGNAIACTDIGVGDVVEVSGTQGDTTVLAGKVTVESPEQEETEVSGMVSSIDCGAGTMVLTTDSGDVTVTFTDATTFKSKGKVATCGDIAVGDAAEASGVLQDDGSLVADKVSFEAPEIEETEVSGTIDTIDTGAGSFVLTTDSGPVTVTTDSSTIVQEHHDLKTFADLASGMSVEVEGILQTDGSILATKISIEDSGD